MILAFILATSSGDLFTPPSLQLTATQLELPSGKVLAEMLAMIMWASSGPRTLRPACRAAQATLFNHLAEKPGQKQILVLAIIFHLPLGLAKQKS